MLRLRVLFAAIAFVTSFVAGLILTAAPSAALPDAGIRLGCETNPVGCDGGFWLGDD